MTDPHELATPCLLVDLDVLEANIHAMSVRAGELDVTLRPHVKTHKSPEIARRQVAAGAAGITVATVAEAEIFAAAGFDDLFIGYPVWVDPAKGHRIRALLDRARLRLAVDSPEATHALAAQLHAAQLHPSGGDGRVSVLIEVDSGHHRSGALPREAGALADLAAHSGLTVDGVFTFPGHSYSPGAGSAVAAEEAEALAAAAASLAERGLTASVVSGGSTPSVPATGPGAMTEMRPGVYVFGDAQQWELGTTTPDQIALTCLATVVSHAGGRAVLDAGSKALAADRAPWASGHGRLLDHPDARIVQLSEHHAVVDWSGGPLPEIGSRVRVVPNHVCNAVNLADSLTVVSNGAVVDTWPVAARGANT